MTLGVLQIYAIQKLWRTQVVAQLGTFDTAIAAAAAILAGLGTAATQNYTEGNWTPTLIGSTTPGTQTYVQQVGTYIRMGNLVTAWFRVEISALDVTTAGNVLIGGIPFTAATITNQFFTGSLSAINNIAHVGALEQQFGIRVPTNGSAAQLIEFGQPAGGSAFQVTVAGLSATSSIFGVLTYKGA